MRNATGINQVLVMSVIWSIEGRFKHIVVDLDSISEVCTGNWSRSITIEVSAG
jgi:hypothetical protein